MKLYYYDIEAAHFMSLMTKSSHIILNLENDWRGQSIRHFEQFREQYKLIYAIEVSSLLGMFYPRGRSKDTD